jgi:nitrogenase molybdenum-iron protein NifN
MGLASWTIAVGEQMRPAAEALERKTGVPFRLFDRLTGLEANDRLVAFLAEISGRPVPHKYRRQRGQLVDAMLDGHFHIGGRRIAIGAEPDLLFAMGSMLHEMGADICAAVTTTHSPLLERLPAAEVVIGDLEDLEARAAAAHADLLITHSHGRQASERLGIPLFRMGMPMFDWLGAGHLTSVGYRGSRDLVFAIGNLLMHQHFHHAPTPETWREHPSALPVSPPTRQEFVR